MCARIYHIYTNLMHDLNIVWETSESITSQNPRTLHWNILDTKPLLSVWDKVTSVCTLGGLYLLRKDLKHNLYTHTHMPQV